MLSYALGASPLEQTCTGALLQTGAVLFKCTNLAWHQVLPYKLLWSLQESLELHIIQQLDSSMSAALGAFAELSSDGLLEFVRGELVRS